MRWGAYLYVTVLVMAGAARCALAQSRGGLLEVPPRIIATPAAQSTAAAPRDEVAPPNDSSPPTGALPYLGAAVEYIESNDTPGAEVHGLEVVSVDPNSPAEQAGLRGQGELTEMGASGATAGELMAPLNLIIMPLLKKAGKLGADGDLIVAIDDNRVESANALETALASLKPGEIMYLTIVRLHRDGPHETLKLPVKLGAPRDLSTDADPFAQAR